MQTETGADAGRRRGVASGLGPSSTSWRNRGGYAAYPMHGATVELGTSWARFGAGSHGAGSLKSNVVGFALAGTVTSDALGMPFATFAPGGAAAAVAWIGLFAEAADLVEKGMAI